MVSLCMKVVLKTCHHILPTPIELRGYPTKGVLYLAKMSLKGANHMAPHVAEDKC